MVKFKSGHFSVQDFPKDKIGDYPIEILYKIYRYAYKWATLIEERMRIGLKLSSVAEETHYESNTEGLTYIMREKAILILEEVWFYGPELRRWYELQKDR